MKSGQDSYGRFKLVEGKQCSICLTEDQFIVVYWPRQPQLPMKIQLEDTILNRALKQGEIPQLGVTCGCYAKFHRQVVHIEDKMKARTK